MTTEMWLLLITATLGPLLSGIAAGYLMERANQRWWARYWTARRPR